MEQTDHLTQIRSKVAWVKLWKPNSTMQKENKKDLSLSFFDLDINGDGDNTVIMIRVIML